MTTGTRTYGNVGTAQYFYKYWSGSDGRTNGSGGVKFNSYTLITFRVFQKRKDIYGRRWLYELQNGCCFPEIVSWTANDSIDLLNRLSTEIRGHSFNLGVTAATSRQSISMIYDTVVRLTHSMRLLKKGRLGDSVRALGVSPRRRHDRIVRLPRGQKELASKDVSSLWLEIQYGWRPLLSDAYEAQKAFVRHTSKPRVMKVSASKAKKGEFKQAYNTVWDPSYGWRQFSTNATQTLKVTYNYTFTEVLSSPRSLGLTDPLSIAWEVIPFSFVADWFIPVGDYLEALNTIPFLNGSTVQIVCYKYKGICIGNPYAQPNNQCEGSETYGTQTRATRSDPGVLYVPRPVFKSLEEALSPGHMKNAIALLHQVFA